MTMVKQIIHIENRVFFYLLFFIFALSVQSFSSTIEIQPESSYSTRIVIRTPIPQIDSTVVDGKTFSLITLPDTDFINTPLPYCVIPMNLLGANARVTILNVRTQELEVASPFIPHAQDSLNEMNSLYPTQVNTPLMPAEVTLLESVGVLSSMSVYSLVANVLQDDL